MMSVFLATVPKRSPVLQLTGIRKSFNVGQANETEVLHGIDLTLFPGEFCAVIGPSGSGKSTLLNTIGLLTDLPRVTCVSMAWTPRI